ncbi:MAG TPA: Xaa-Pro peptidase family protein [Vicinamibacterales bacterium]|jgi:Xaa-Pro aminopeptidase|nr:Xaa-Pro peptidase family protein [Vicinamibacterales bacterium]
MSHAPSAALSARHTTVREALAARTLEALVITSLPNILYLTSFTGSAAIVVLTADRLYFITDFRYVAAVSEMTGTPCECPGLDLVKVDGSYDATLSALLMSRTLFAGGLGRPRRIGFEAEHLTVSRHLWLSSALSSGETSDTELVATEGIVERARLVKDAFEIATLREAARRLSAVARELPREIRAGRTERDVAMAIDFRLHQAGFARTAFDTIVASGPNAALPHARPGERKFVEGDLVVLDFGGVYDSYCVDLTRTVTVGRASTRAREVYGAVLEAHDRAVASVAPGQSRFAIDAAARDVLARHDLAEAFGHGTGHGLGIEVHEDPRITRRRPADDEGDAGDGGDHLAGSAVRAGMVFTIEPGAYLPGWGGVRIEDDVLVTEEGVEVLTSVTTELLEI